MKESGEIISGVSIHAPNEGSDLCVVQDTLAFDVSIHAPNEGSDVLQVSVTKDRDSFNPRSQ